MDVTHAKWRSGRFTYLLADLEYLLAALWEADHHFRNRFCLSQDVSKGQAFIIRHVEVLDALRLEDLALARDEILHVVDADVLIRGQVARTVDLEEAMALPLRLELAGEGLCCELLLRMLHDLLLLLDLVAHI